jgi:glutathione synthase/RimK-type ligase-like ATP-grasp enzyme
MILVGKDGRPSMKAVYEQMDHNCELRIRRKIGNREWFRTYNNNNSNHFTKKNVLTPIYENVIIRWGNRIDIKEISNNPIVYNNIKCLDIITDKKLSRQVLVKNNVKTPYYDDKDVEYEILNDDTQISFINYPVIIRPRTHSKGKNFFVINHTEELRCFFSNKNLNDYYCAPYLDKTNEYRVHCFLGKVLSVLEKPKPSDINQKAWNRALNNTDPFTYIPWSEYNYDLCITALQACKAVGADFAAVDIIKYHNRYYVLELNSSPTLISNDYTVSRYAKAFDYIHKHTYRTKLKHWNFEKFKDAKSLAWKNFQLESEENIIE